MFDLDSFTDFLTGCGAVKLGDTDEQIAFSIRELVNLGIELKDRWWYVKAFAGGEYSGFHFNWNYITINDSSGAILFNQDNYRYRDREYRIIDISEIEEIFSINDIEEESFNLSDLYDFTC